MPEDARYDPATRRGQIGQSIPRIEDETLLAGKGLFAGDWHFPDMLHMRVVRSPVAHGEIRGIDASVALGLDGVAAVWTADDVADIPPIDFRATKYTGLDPYKQPVLANARVRFVGEPVAAVFAESAAIAEDAAALVALDIAELPPLLEADASPGDSSTAWIPSRP